MEVCRCSGRQTGMQADGKERRTDGGMWTAMQRGRVRREGGRMEEAMERIGFGS